MRRRLTTTLTALGAITALVAGMPTAAYAAPSTAASQDVAWRDCGDGLQCGEITVPADWSEPHGSARITVGLAKLPARDPAHRIGTLVANPGGPGPAIGNLPNSKEGYSELTEWFDVVLFDPRGFGASNGVDCPTPLPYPSSADFTFPGRGAYQKQTAANRRYVADCAKDLGVLRGGLSSWQVAHDLEAIRVALGQRKLDYFGTSYGTVFGQAYAELFGRHVGRMYLDSVVDHTERDLYRWAASRAATAENNLRRFARWCAERTSCALHGEKALATYDQVIATAERHPIPAPGAGPGATASASLIAARAGIVNGGASTWPTFATALAEAAEGDASWFAKVPGGSIPDATGEPDLGRLMQCADYPYTTDYDTLKAIEAKLRNRVAPRVGWTQLWQNSSGPVLCTGLPRTGTYPPHPARAQAGLPPILVANGDHDATTPPRFGRHVVTQLPGARYLPVDGDHALYLNGNPCVRRHVHRYLTTGAMPPRRASCPATS